MQIHKPSTSLIGQVSFISALSLALASIPIVQSAAQNGSADTVELGVELGGVASKYEAYQALFNLGQADDKYLTLDIVTKRRLTLAENVDAIRVGDHIFFDLVEIAQIMGGMVKWDGQRLAGWVRSESELIELDLGAKTISYGEVSKQLGENDAFVENGILFTNSNLIGALYGIQFDLELHQLRILVSGPPTAGERRRLRARAHQSLGIRDREGGDNTETEFAGYDEPAPAQIKISASSSLRRAKNGNGKNTHSSSLYTTAYFDLFTSRVKLITNATKSDGVRDIRVTSRRINPDRSKYSELEIGDVRSFQLVNGGNSKDGVGVRVTNRPLYRSLHAGEETISGDATPGWQAELYHEDILIDINTVDQTGRFRFGTTPLKSGKNNFIVKLHGPQGQLETIERSVYANGGVPPKNTFYYNLSAQRDGTSVTGLRERRERRQRRRQGRTTTENHHRMTGEIKYGVTNETAITAGVSQVPNNGNASHNGRHNGRRNGNSGGKAKNAQLLTTGIQSNINGNPYTVDVTTGVKTISGNALRIYSRVPLGASGATITYNKYDDFTGASAQHGNSFYRNKLRLYFYLPQYRPSPTAKSVMNSSFLYDMSTRKSGGKNELFSPRLSLNHGQTSFSAAFGLRRATSTKSKRTNSGTVTLSAFHAYNGGNISAVIRGNVQPKANLKSYSLTKRTYHSAEMSTNTRIIHRPGRKAQTDLNWGISKSTESLKFSFNAALNSQGRHSASFSISSHLTTTPDGSALRWRDSIRADKGTIVASAFVDKNGDQMRNPGEEMLPNPEIQTRYVIKELKTDENKVVLEDLPAYRPITIEVNPGFSEYPMLSRTYQSKDVILRDGGVAHLDFGFQPTGEIIGATFVRTVNEDGTSSLRGLSGVLLEIVSSDGKVIARTRSQHDGYFVFANVVFDTYTVRASRQYLEGKEMIDVKEATRQKVTLSQNNEWAENLQVILVSKSD